MFLGGLAHAIEFSATGAAGHQSESSRHGVHATASLVDVGFEHLKNGG